MQPLVGQVMQPLVGLVWLQAGGAEPSPFSMLAPMLAIFLIFWLLLIRPQQRRQREQEQMLKSIERGDDVVTTGGLHGRVVGVTDDTLTLEIAAVKGEKVRVKVARNRIESRTKGKEKEES